MSDQTFAEDRDRSIAATVSEIDELRAENVRLRDRAETSEADYADLVRDHKALGVLYDQSEAQRAALEKRLAAVAEAVRGIDSPRGRAGAAESPLPSIAATIRKQLLKALSSARPDSTGADRRAGDVEQHRAPSPARHPREEIRGRLRDELCARVAGHSDLALEVDLGATTDPSGAGQETDQ